MKNVFVSVLLEGDNESEELSLFATANITRYPFYPDAGSVFLVNILLASETLGEIPAAYQCCFSPRFHYSRRSKIRYYLAIKRTFENTFVLKAGTIMLR
jgi:hypothetical protein